MAIIRGVLEGTTQLIMNNIAGMGTQATVKGKKAAEVSREDEAEKSAYRLPDGGLYMPAVAVRKCILEGCKGMKVGKRFATKVMPGALVPVDMHFPLVDKKGKPLTTYEIFITAVVIDKKRVLKARPRLSPPWFLVFSFELFTGDVAAPAIEEVVKLSLSTAGQSVGIGDWRPEKGGWFGKFKLESLEIIE